MTNTKTESSNKLKDGYEMLVPARFVSTIEKHFFNINDNSIGSMSNAIEEVTEEIKRGYGWVGHEAILEDNIVQLISYSRLRPMRQIPVRNYDTTSKNKTRRFDLIFGAVGTYRYKWYDYIQLSPHNITLQKLLSSRYYRLDNNLRKREPLVVTEIKSGYFTREDIVDICSIRNYPQLAYRHFEVEENQTMIMQLVSPGGLTDSALKELQKIQQNLDEQGLSNIIIKSVKLDYFINTQIFGAIEDSYSDDRGAVGKQYSYVKDDIKYLCFKICHPNIWLEEYSQLQCKIMTCYRESDSR